MKLVILLLLILILINCNENEDNEIITIPESRGNFKNIKTKFGFIDIRIDLYFDNVILPEFGGIETNNYFIIKNLKNMELLNKHDYSNENGIVFDLQDNNSLFIDIKNDYYSKNKINLLLCDIFYKTKYINKKIYFVLKNKYKYFGGDPKINSLNLTKFSFNKNEKVTEMVINLASKRNIYLNINKEKYLVEFIEDQETICFPNEILQQLKNIFLNNYEKCKNYYVLKKPIKFFTYLKFKIGDKTIYLENEDIHYLFSEYITKGKESYYKSYFNYLYIKNEACNNFVFGIKFLELFDARKFNLETGEIDLFINNENNTIIYDKKILSFNFHYLFIILFIFIFQFIFILFLKNHKNNRIEYFNNYYFDI